MGQLVPFLLVAALVVYPFWRILTRAGHSGAWALFVFVPLGALVLLWVVAFMDWPALQGRPAQREVE